MNAKILTWICLRRQAVVAAWMVAVLTSLGPIGPTLSNFEIAGALQDPTLDLVNSNGVVLRSNNNWRDSQEAAITATGLQPSDNREAALIETLAPGNYTAILCVALRTAPAWDW